MNRLPMLCFDDTWVSERLLGEFLHPVICPSPACDVFQVSICMPVDMAFPVARVRRRLQGLSLDGSDGLYVPTPSVGVSFFRSSGPTKHHHSLSTVDENGCVHTKLLVTTLLTTNYEVGREHSLEPQSTRLNHAFLCYDSIGCAIVPQVLPPFHHVCNDVLYHSLLYVKIHPRSLPRLTVNLHVHLPVLFLILHAHKTRTAVRALFGRHFCY